ncbi:hypothetical protein ONE63_010020 [Megalurothrips usitatus]|uniref:Gustatory receptor n=1 Tax=Megalurothrips usitatus TaxID=439358 RepID=A0AAV7XNF0_9NEOP|nr:hypothetical protein ONE63_010020 [Megalurothrips usitatus]
MAGGGNNKVLPGVYIVHATPLAPRAPADVGPGRSPGHGRDSLADASVRASRSRVDAEEADVGGRRLSCLAGAVAAADLERRAESGCGKAVAADGDVNTGIVADDLDEDGKRVLRAIARVVRPIVLVLAIYGVLPVRLSCPALRISVHPLRSSLLYVVVMQVLVLLSSHAVYQAYSGLLNTEADTAAGVDTRIMAGLSVSHVSSHLIVALWWTEMHKLRCHLRDLQDFLRRHSHMIVALRLQPLTRAMPWFAWFFSFAAGPCMIIVWSVYILTGTARFTHCVSHLYQHVFVTNFIVLFGVACMVLRDLAANLASNLKRELAFGHMTASRLEEFRLAWLSLRALTANLGCLPLTCVALIAYIMIMITLSAYLALVSYAKNYVVLFVCSITLHAMCQMAMIGICDAAHRLSDVMTYSFYEPLEARSWRGLPADLLAEHQQFLHTISCNPAEVTFAGMVTLKRSTYISVMAAITTYLIVLFQLRQSDEALPAPPPNATEAPLNAVFSQH